MFEYILHAISAFKSIFTAIFSPVPTHSEVTLLLFQLTLRLPFSCSICFLPNQVKSTSTQEKSTSVSCWSKPNLYCNYTFPNWFGTPKGIQFAAKSIGKSVITTENFVRFNAIFSCRFRQFRLIPSAIEKQVQMTAPILPFPSTPIRLNQSPPLPPSLTDQDDCTSPLPINTMTAPVPSPTL